MKSEIFNGTEDSIIKILAILPNKYKAVRSRENALTIPTPTGAKDVYLNETVVVDGENVLVIP